MDGEILPLAVAIALGLLVGLERQTEGSRKAGIRTFPLISLLGALAGLVASPQSWGVLAVGWASLTVLVTAANLQRWRTGEGGFGITTEIAVLVMFTVGFLVAQGYMVPALVAAGTVVVLLHHREQMHAFVKRLTDAQLGAVVKLALIALVILPALPDKAYGPYGVLNPREIWMMVVLIAGISVAAYLVQQLLGARVGSVLGGILGGLISSTASTVSYARQARKAPNAVQLAAIGILIASTVVNVRVAAEVAVASPTLFPTFVWPMAILAAVMVVQCLLLWWASVRDQALEAPSQDNPAQLGAAIAFGLLYAVVLFAVAAVRDQFGEEALYAVAAVSGLTDVDAITLSTARLYEAGRVEASTAWRVIVIAVMSNTLFKLGAVRVLGGPALFRRVAVQFGIVALVAAGLIVLWPR